MTEPIFVLTLPLELAPTLNTYCNMQTWQRQKVRTTIDELIRKEIAFLLLANGCILAPFMARGAKRKVVVTRFSSSEPDEYACDILGAKLPIDCLVRAGLLAGDSRKHLVREARWIKSRPKEGKLVVEIYEIESESV